MEEEVFEYTEGIIRKVGSQYCIFSKDGSKKLGCYSSKDKAVKRLRQIEYFKQHGNVVGTFCVNETPDDPRNKTPEPDKSISTSDPQELINKNIIGKIL